MLVEPLACARPQPWGEFGFLLRPGRAAPANGEGFVSQGVERTQVSRKSRATCPRLPTETRVPAPYPGMQLCRCRKTIEKHILPVLGRKRALSLDHAAVSAFHHALGKTPAAANKAVEMLFRIYRKVRAGERTVRVAPENSKPSVMAAIWGRSGAARSGR